jgi:hypothetical protein
MLCRVQGVFILVKTVDMHRLRVDRIENASSSAPKHQRDPSTIHVGCIYVDLTQIF